MHTHLDKTHPKNNPLHAAPVSQERDAGGTPSPSVDKRPEALAQRKRQAAANNSPQALQLKALQGRANMRPQPPYPAPSQHPSANKTGLPDPLKSGIERLSGIAMDDVTVHYNSDQPAKLQAYAYAQGTDIHLGPGQEKNLPHEAWHVVQQKRKQVQPTLQMKAAAGPSDPVQVNDDAGLEKEADLMGAKAMQVANAAAGLEDKPLTSAPIHHPVTQRLVLQYGIDKPIPEDARIIAENQDETRGRKIKAQTIPGTIPQEVFAAMEDKEKIYIVGHGVAALGNSPAILEDGPKNKMTGPELAAVIDALKTGLETEGKSIGPVKLEACMSSLSRQTKKGKKHTKPSLLTDIRKSLARDFKVDDVQLEGNPGMCTGYEFDEGGVKNASPANTEVSLLIKALEYLYREKKADWNNEANEALKKDALRIIKKQRAVLDAYDLEWKENASTAELMYAYLKETVRNDNAHKALSRIKTSLGKYIRQDPT